MRSETSLQSGPTADADADRYVLDEQIGFLLRRAHQRHLGIFNAHMAEGLTAQQFAVLVRVDSVGETSQNELGRKTAMDQSTINGVVQRLIRRGLIQKGKSAHDRRLLMLSITQDGRDTLHRIVPTARQITEKTLEPLTPRERETLIRLLRQIA